jgi:hypothetical protein
MLYKQSVCAIVFATSLCATIAGVQTADDPKYPNWKGLWNAINYRFDGQVIKYDPNKPWGPAQKAPLTPEYQKVLEDSMADQANGGIGNYRSAHCAPGGMPRTMAGNRMEYVITPETTYILGGPDNVDVRRIFTDGRAWPKESELEPTYLGFSIGRWLDEDGNGVYDVLEVKRGARSRAQGPMMEPGCRCTSTISRHLRSGCISTNTIRTSCMTRSPLSITL